MKKLLLFLVIFSSITFAQFKGDESKPLDIQGGILSENPMSSLFSFINPNNFNMSHSFSMSYSSFGNDGMALGVYTNHMSYKFNDQLDFQLDASLVNSPYNSLGDNFTNAVNGVYIDRARLNYRPSEDFNVTLEFSNSPLNYYNSYSRYSSFSRYSRFGFGY